MELILLSFFAGILTVLAPCVLPLLPIILAKTSENIQDKVAPYIIIASLWVSILIFSLLIKASTLFIQIPQYFWAYFSGWVIFLFWIITIFPNIWKKIASKTKIDQKSNEVFAQSTQKSWIYKNTLIWFALWPIFSSCSPTYALILAVILPQSIFIWVLNLVSYVVWLGLILLIIAIFWQKIVSKLKIFANPNGWFKKILWIVFLIIWFMIFTWYDKKIETYLIQHGYYIDTSSFEWNIVDTYIK